MGDGEAAAFGEGGDGDAACCAEGGAGGSVGGWLTVVEGGADGGGYAHCLGGGGRWGVAVAVVEVGELFCAWEVGHCC